MFVGCIHSCEVFLVFDQVREVALDSIYLSVVLKAKALDDGRVVALFVLRVEVLQVGWVHEVSVRACNSKETNGLEVGEGC